MRISGISVHLPSFFPFDRCGQCHIVGQCRAVKAQCFGCHRMGHFKVVCKWTEIRLKSARSKQRDSGRIAAFICKKTAESLPFSEIVNEELSSCFPKNPAVQENFLQKLRGVQVSALRDKEDLLLKQKNLQIKLADSQNLVTELRRGYQNNQEEMHLQEYKVKKTEEKLDLCEQRKQETCEFLKQISDLALENENVLNIVEHSKRQKLNLNSDLHEMTSQRNALYSFASKVNDYIVKLYNEHECVKQELASVLHNAYEKECNRSCHPNRDFECRKCGSKNFHFHVNCLAHGNKCKICLSFTRTEQLYVLSHDRSWGRGWDAVKPV